MTPFPTVATVKVGKFDAARVFPPEDKLTLPLLRLMLATDDMRQANLLLITANHQVDQTTGIQQTFHGARLWYAFRLLCSHVKEGINAFGSLTSNVAQGRLNDLLRERPAAIEALTRLRSAGGKETFITKVRDSIGFHYRQGDIERVFNRDLASRRIDASVIASDVGLLSRFIITDVIALHMLDDAAGASLTGGDEEFLRRANEVTALAADLFTFVDNLVAALLKQHGSSATTKTIEVPPLYRAACDAIGLE
jgi:hypothetical protein